MNISSKFLVIAGLLVLIASLAVPAFAKEADVDHAYVGHSHDGHAHVEDLIMSDQDDNTGKYALKHYDVWGNWTGSFHYIDFELYNQAVSIILANGGIPSDKNVDRLLHGSGYGNGNGF